MYPYAAQTKLATKVAASALAAEQAETEATLSRPAFLSAKGLTPAELKRLIEQSYLTEAQANAVDLTRVEKFFTGPLGQRVLHADRVYKEQRFIVSIPAGLTDKTLSGEDAAQPMILQAMTRVMNNEVKDTVLYSFYMNAPVYARGKE